VADWIFGILDRLGAPGVGLLILLENLIPPIPSEVVLPLAGFRSSSGDLNVLAVWCAATLDAVLGALALYGLGAGLGYDRLYRPASNWWFVLASQSDIDRGHGLFERRGGKVVVLGRCVPFLRSVVSIPAGVLGIRCRASSRSPRSAAARGTRCSSGQAGGWGNAATGCSPGWVWRASS
jgi:membrane protein DedA with SNARE-associated domain